MDLSQQVQRRCADFDHHEIKRAVSSQRTNIIENPNGIVRRTSRRVTRYRDAEMALRWTARGFIEAQKSFREIQGIKDLWILKAALGRTEKQAHVDEAKLAAQRAPDRRRLQLPAGHRPARANALGATRPSVEWQSVLCLGIAFGHTSRIEENQFGLAMRKQDR
jgi:hypothetical protein